MRTAITLIAGLALAFAVAGDAAVPEIMSYQGVLRDAAGDPVPDGVYDMTFRLYDVETGGTALWTETQSVSVADGVMNVYLGDVTPLTTLDFDAPYWLGISVSTEPELEPRTRLATAPYAARAVFAEEADDDWEIDGDDVYHQNGNVGIGTSTMDSRFEVAAGDARGVDIENSSGAGHFAIRARNLAGTAGGFYSSTAVAGYPTTPTAVYGYAGGSAQGGFFVAQGDGTGLIGQSQGAGPALRGWAVGTGYSGYFTGTQGVLVEGPIDVDGFTMSTGASPGYVLTSDASGVGTWQASTGGIGGGGTANYIPKFTGAATIGNSMLYDTGADVGLGTTSPGAKLDVEDSDGGEALEVTSTSASSTSRIVDIERTGSVVAGNDIVQIVVPPGSSSASQFVECELGANNVVFAVDGDGLVYSDAGADFGGQVDVASTTNRAGTFESNSSAYDVYVVTATYTGTGSTQPMAFRGECEPADGEGIGGFFEGGFEGVEGRVTPTSSDPGLGYRGVGGYVLGEDVAAGGCYGVVGTAEGTDLCIGVDGYARGTGRNRGIYGASNFGTVEDYAGYFSGDVTVHGTLSKTAGAFRIDHPLDPENKYLQHSFVESPDMMNVYNGNVILDGAGEASVQLPEWFEALNEDFRYQLTAIGAPGPNLHIAEEISGNHFRIAGGDPGMKVSWLVTGIRHDRYAEAHRIEVETDKHPLDRGKYLHPDLYGMDRTTAIGYVPDEHILPREDPGNQENDRSRVRERGEADSGQN